jgi:hypothetical protein
MLKEWGISDIYTASDKHKRSYFFLKTFFKNKISIHSLESISFSKTRLILILLKSKIQSKNIYFFHECSWPFFDLLIKIINPNGHYIPQVSMNAFEIIDETRAKTITNSFLKNFFIHIFSSLFNYYTKKDDNDQKYKSIYFKLKNYPKKIRTEEIIYSTDIVKKKTNDVPVKNNKILILADKDTISNQILNDNYNNIINMCTSINFECYVKSHPNKDFRLNIINKNSNQIDSTIPAELIFDEYQFIIGTSSTSLVFFYGISISIINFFSDCYSIDKTKKHFNGIDNNKIIFYPTNIDQLIDILKENIND